MTTDRSRRFRKALACSAVVFAPFASQVMSSSVVHAAACIPTETVVGSTKLLTFSTVDTCQWTVPSGVTSVDVLIVGGGGGGSADVGGGGGGGQVVESTNVAVSGIATVTVGAGGAAGYNRVGNSTGGGRMGGTSSFAVAGTTVSAKGGSGAIGRYGANNLNADGTPNNSGYTGGGGAYADTGESATGSTGTGGASFKGGNGSGSGGGGGGGAGGAGASRSSNSNGGIGLSSNITGATIFYGGGGGGSGYGPSAGVGGTGGGGDGTNNGNDGNSGVNGRGGGGGGAGSNGAPTGRGGHGGSGVVIVRFTTPIAPVNVETPVVTGTLQGGGVLSTTTGAWSGSPTSYSFQWKRAASLSGVYTNITSAVASSYVLTDDDIGRYLKAEVIATNTAGPGNAVLSNSVGPIAAPPVITTTTTAAPALEIVVVAPSTTVPVGQSQIPVVSSVPTSSTTSVAPKVIATTTTTTTTVKPSDTVAPKAPSAPSVVAGSAAVKVGDKTETATVERADNQLVVSAGALKAVVGGLNPDGSQMSLDDDGNVRLNTGDTVRIKLAGFKPGAVMEAWLFSTPVLLGTTKVGADGSVTGTFTIPKDAPEGAHRVVIVAQTTDGKPATLAIGINVGEWDSGPGVALWLIVLPIAFAVVGALVVPAQRRRRRAVQ
jgi:hypothetical protein